MSEEIKKRGRPPLSDEEREARRVERSKASNEYHKQAGYAAQKKYQQSHKEQYQEYKKQQRGVVYEPKIRIPMEKKEDLTDLLEQEGLSLTQMFASLVKEKYGIDLLKSNDS